MKDSSSIAKSALPLILLAGAGPGLAQEGRETVESGMEEVIVTAQYRQQSVLDVPIAMDAFSADDLDKASVTGLADLTRLAPDFAVVNDLGFVRLSVRGVQSNSNDEGGDQAMVFNIDGDYINRGNFINAAMFDLERVEVLRGPQGTLYGRNATAGAMNVIARKPALAKLEGAVSADVGNYSSRIYNGAINVPLGQRAAVRIAAMAAEHDGYTSHPNFAEDTNIQDSEAYRIGLLIEPADAWSVYLAAEYAEEYLIPSYAGALSLIHI